MFQPWRLKLRQAEEALKGGRLDEASQLLAEDDLREYQPAQRLVGKLTAAVLDRGTQRVARGETLAGWRDLEIAERLGAGNGTADALRQTLVDRGLHEAQGYLVAGNPAAALERVEEILARAPRSREATQLKQVASKLETARREARKGKFVEAESLVREAAALRPDLGELCLVREQYHHQAEQSRQLSQRLHEALAGQQWSSALAAADELLQLAPECTLARDARYRAWAAVGHRLNESYVPAHARGPVPHVLGQGDTSAQGDTKIVPPELKYEPGPRLRLWVDGVGGYLVCQGDRVVLGRPDPESQIDIPILGDLSHHHAVIRRDAEGYTIEPLRSVKVNGTPISKPTMLGDVALLELGSSVRIKFRRPHPLSGTAVLQFASTHRTQPSCDAVLLMAESLVLGPAGHNHVECRNWGHDVVLSRQGTQLHCKAPGTFTVDGHVCEGRGPLTASAKLVGEGFSLSLEQV